MRSRVSRSNALLIESILGCISSYGCIIYQIKSKSIEILGSGYVVGRILTTAHSLYPVTVGCW
jgi:hypothetical protein